MIMVWSLQCASVHEASVLVFVSQCASVHKPVCQCP